MRFEDWEVVTIGEVIEIFGGGTPKTTKPEYWNGGIPWLSVKDFNNGFRYVYTTEKTITEKGLQNSSTQLLNKDDIIISARGTVGELSMIPFPMAFNQSCYGIRGKKNIVDNVFLFYLLKQNVATLISNAHGSVFDTITRSTFDGLTFSLPSLALQKKIANILSSLDDKIELNNKINANLEKQAQAIFKSWFVDFKPFQDGEFVESEMGMIPKGWRVGRFTEIVDVLGGGTPNTQNDNYWNGSIPFFTPKDTNNSCFVLSTEKYLTNEGLNNCNSKLYSKFTVFITARGTVGKIAIAGKNMAMNQSCYALVGKKGYGQLYLYYFAIEAVKSLKNKATGAVFNALVTRDFDSEYVIIPPVDIAKKFEITLLPSFNMILTNAKQNLILMDLRDTLLPKLMSGEIEV